MWGRFLLYPASSTLDRETLNPTQPLAVLYANSISAGVRNFSREFYFASRISIIGILTHQSRSDGEAVEKLDD